MMPQDKLKILLFGGTRHTGLHFMQQALTAGDQITAIMRDPSSITYRHLNLKVVKDNALELQTFESEFVGKDVIISSLGPNGADFRKPTIICSQGLRNMMDGMKKYGVKRIMCISAGGLDTNPEMGFVVKLIARLLQFILKEPYQDLKIMEAEIKASGLDWTIVRASRLTDGPVTGNYRAAIGSHLSWPFSIRRADVADFLRNHITDEKTYRKVVELAY